MDNNIEWGLSNGSVVHGTWPKNEDGTPMTPVIIRHCYNLNFEDDLILNMLEAYGIPCFRQYTGDGSFGKLILGVSGQGSDIYVPLCYADEAKKLCEGEGYDENL